MNLAGDAGERTALAYVRCFSQAETFALKTPPVWWRIFDRSGREACGDLRFFAPAVAPATDEALRTAAP